MQELHELKHSLECILYTPKKWVFATFMSEKIYTNKLFFFSSGIIKNQTFKNEAFLFLFLNSNVESPSQKKHFWSN